MHSLHLILLCMTLTGFVGCTRSPESSSQAPRPEEDASTPAPAPQSPSKSSLKDDRPVIVALGDSLSEGLGVKAGLSFPDQLQVKLDKSGYAYRVVNMGVSGDTTTGGLGRLEYAASLQPSIVILELGGNDGLRGIPVASTKANLEKIIVAFQKAGTEVLLAGMTLPPNYGPEYIRQFEGAYKDLAEEYKLRLIPFLMEDILVQYRARTGLMQRDGVHPTADGHTIIADTVFRYLEPMLKRS